MGYLIGGIVAAVLAFISFFVMKMVKKSLFTVLSSPKRSCGELQEVSRQVAEEIGAGMFSERCKVRGKIAAESPLIAEISGNPCVYYESKVYRKYEEVEVHTDADGSRKQTRETEEELLSSNKNHIPFKINDGTGEITVGLDGAEIGKTEKALDQFIPGEPESQTLSFGRFKFRLEDVNTGLSRTLGYRYEEDIIPLGAELMVVGEASDASGTLRMQEPEDHEYTYLATLETEQEYVKSAKTSIKIFGIAGAVLSIGAVALLAVYVFR
jgi:hypothetical protein